MTDNELPGAIIGRLARVRAIESQLVDRFEQLATTGAIDPKNATRSPVSRHSPFVTDRSWKRSPAGVVPTPIARSRWAALELAALNDLLAPAVHGELLSVGLTCRCVCPTCGIGACGCTRNSIDKIRGYWGQPELEPGEGLVLRMPPRPGSKLAEAGLERGDRIISVDGQLVHTNAEIQRALRGHPIGESMPMEVVRSGESKEITLARVSDLPS
jgi:membrane-associated protease RseP (regulator of RpoE activity)